MKKILYILLLISASVDAQTVGIKIAAPLIKNDPSDNTVTGYAHLIAGGYFGVPTLAGRDSITTVYTKLLRDGLKVFVRADNTEYRWKSSTSSWETTGGTVDSTIYRTVANSFTKAQTNTYLAAKQNTLVSGTNIKTINGSTILGSGDMTISGGGSGTVSSITPGVGFTSNTPITTTGTLNIDTSSIRSTSNSFTKAQVNAADYKRVSKTAIELFSQTYFTSSSNFTATGTTLSTSNGELVLPAGISDYSKYITANNTINNNENFQWEVVFKATSITAGTSIGIGKISINTWIADGYCANLDITTGIVKVTNAKTPEVVIGTKSLLNNIALNDIIRFRYLQYGTSVTVIVENTTKKTSDNFTIFITTPPNTGSFGIWNLAGSKSIVSMKATILDPYEPDVISIGDSKTLTMNGSIPVRFASQITQFGTVSVNAGACDRTVEVVQAIPSLIKTVNLAGKYILLNIGRNDLASSVSSATWQANYSSIVSQLTSAGAIVIHLLPIPETTQDQTSLTSWITSTYGTTNTIDVSVGWDNATMLLDGIHPNNKGHFFIASKILASGKIPIKTTPLLIEEKIAPPPVDASLVHLTGVETMSGVKTFSNDILVNGMTVGRGNGSQGSSTALGIGAMAAINTGAFNSAFGNLSLNSNTSGQGNSGLGRGTLSLNTTGNNNTAVGQNALYSNTAGNNTAIGYSAITANTSGTSNTGIGAYALNTSTTGTGNTGIGIYALNGNTTGSSNVGIGNAAGYSSTSASFNVSIGANAGYSLTGSSNVAIGHNAAIFATGSRGVFVGEEAGYNETSNDILHIANNQYNSLIHGSFSTRTLDLIPLGPFSLAPVLTASSSGGTLAAGTYYYVITALDETGQTVKSGEPSVTVTGTTSSVVITWNAVAGAITYRVWRGTSAGNENKYFTVVTNSYTDTGLTGTTGTLPAIATAYSFRISDKGVVLPRVTSAIRDAIPSPVEGLTIYNITTHTLNTYNGSIWENTSVGGGTSGTYTPTLNIYSGVSSVTAKKCHYTRVGNEVSVTGYLVATSVTGSGFIGISLPVASDLAVQEDLSGVASVNGLNQAVFVRGQITDNVAQLTIDAPSTNSPDVYFHFTYTVL